MFCLSASSLPHCPTVAAALSQTDSEFTIQSRWRSVSLFKGNTEKRGFILSNDESLALKFFTSTTSSVHQLFENTELVYLLYQCDYIMFLHPLSKPLRIIPAVYLLHFQAVLCVQPFVMSHRALKWLLTQPPDRCWGLRSPCFCLLPNMFSKASSRSQTQG